MKTKLIVLIALLTSLISCTTKPTQPVENANTIKGTHKARVTLTVAESKRLIAVGLAQYAPIKESLENGTIIITKGTTNSYVAEELLGQEIPQQGFVLGHHLPAKGDRKLDKSQSRSEVVLCNGKDTDIKYTDALEEMKAGDIVIKGANIINYDKGQAGVCIGHPTGGTTGNIVPVIEAKELRLIIPVGLEKESSQDIDLLGEISRNDKESVGEDMPFIWSLKGELFTEIEAVKQFANVEVMHLASGGIGGAEGAVTLVIFGNEEEVKKALDKVESIQGEVEFLEESH